ncbi:hypothetical protein DICVIV_05796 [Dictyocaulus viviparus]|uniref:Uncharacterized protein n=1 Tax=Dictyocaulus viviparus TaxID=29172 RepID=A0A0D8XU87_DICVI|nr:hypothetical protein DICVIV_05796 [Dictyocaulus viviparus]
MCEENCEAVDRSRVDGAMFGIRASTPTRKGAPPQFERVSRRVSVLDQSGRSSGSQCNTQNDKFPSYFNTSQNAVCQSRYSTKSLHRNVDDDTTKVGVPSLRYALSAESYTSSQLNTYDSRISSPEERNAINDKVEFIYGLEDMQVDVSILATINGEYLHLMKR